MSALSTFFGGSNIFPRMLICAASRTWVTPIAGKFRIRALGAGGAGGALWGGSGQGTGGGGGAYCETISTLAAGVTLTITVGSGGTCALGTYSSNGTAGGSTSVSGSGLTTMTAGGGGGGTYCGAYGTAAGGAGGSATGGSVCNFSGGAGGSATASAWGATGGGASGSAYGEGGRGGNITSCSNNSSTTHGGAVGGMNAGDLANQTSGGWTGAPASLYGVGIAGQNVAATGAPAWHGSIAALSLSGAPGTIDTTGFTQPYYSDGSGGFVFYPQALADPIFPLLGGTTSHTGGPGASGGICGGGTGTGRQVPGDRAGRGGGGGGSYQASISVIGQPGGNGLVIIEW
jgi:hypothetical protein